MKTVFSVHLLTCDLKGMKPFLKFAIQLTIIFFFLEGGGNLAQHNAKQFLDLVPTSVVPDYRSFLK